MTSRKKFLRLSALTVAGLAAGKLKAMAPGESGQRPVKKPVVISTWPIGIPANEAAWAVLKAGGRALDAVEAGVKIPEADPAVRTVGYGGRPDRNGKVTVDACIMDEHANIGSVACLEHIIHPISIARAVMEKTPHVMLAGEGALQFALELGYKKENLLTQESEQEWKEWLKTSHYKPVVNIENHDTIGMLALDEHGNLSGGCSTSGMAYKMSGRIGDSPIIGAGLFVDNEVGAATATGQGEEVIRIVGSHMVVELMRQGKTPEQACKMAVERILALLKSRGKNPLDVQIGFVALNKRGVYGAYCLQEGFEYAVYSHDVPNRLFTPAKAL